NWLAGLEKLVVETGLITAEELASGQAAGLAAADVRARLLKEADVARALAQGVPATLPAAAPPRFRAGDRVRALNRHPAGHTREPRYVRGRVGIIHEHHGAHVFPDENAGERRSVGSPVTPGGVTPGRHL